MQSGERVCYCRETLKLSHMYFNCEAIAAHHHSNFIFGELEQHQNIRRQRTVSNVVIQ